RELVSLWRRAPELPRIARRSSQCVLRQRSRRRRRGQLSHASHHARPVRDSACERGADVRAGQPRRDRACAGDDPMNGRAKRALRAAAALALAGACAYGGWRAYRATAGEPSSLLGETWHEGTRILDREGRLLRELPGPGGNRGRSSSRAEMGDRLVLATIVSEDRGFYEHEGIDPVAVARA